MKRRLTCLAIAVTGVASLVAPSLAGAEAPVFSVEPAHSLGITTRASLATGGGEAHAASSQPSIDSDGEVAFASTASDLGPTVSGGHSNVYLRTATGKTILISRTSGGAGGNGDSDQPVIAAGGRLVAFHSTADDLVSADTGGHGDVFLFNRDPMGDGLDGPDHTLTLVSRSSTAAQGNGDSDQPALAESSSGPYIAFRSAATNLDSGDSNGKTDVFLRHDGATGRVSLTSADAQITTGDSAHPAIAATADAVFVAFQCSGDGVTPNDSNGFSDVFLAKLPFSIAAAQITMLSESSLLDAGDGASSAPSISDDGQRVAFQSDAHYLAYDNDYNNATDVFVRDVPTGTTELVSWSRLMVHRLQTSNAASTAPAISGNGRFIAFVSRSTDLGASDSNAANDVYEYQQDSPIVTRLSQSSSDEQANAASSAPALATGGRYAAFASDASDLVGSDSNAVTDVFRRQRDIDAPDSLTGTPDANHVIDGSTWSSNLNIAATLRSTEVGDVQSGVGGYYWRLLLPKDSVGQLDPIDDVVPPMLTGGPVATVAQDLGAFTLPNFIDPLGCNIDCAGTVDVAKISGPVRFQVRALDRSGNLGPTTIVGPYLIDGIKPTLTGKVTPSGVVAKSRKVKLKWQGTDAMSGVKSYDVYYERNADLLINAKPKQHYLLRNTTKRTLMSPRLARGSYTWFVVAHDAVGNSATREIGGDVLPTSVKRLHFSSDWTRSKARAFLGGYAVTATRANASFKIKTVNTRGVISARSFESYTVAMVATTCPACGKVAVLVHLPSRATICWNPDGTEDYGSTCATSPRLVRTVRYKSVNLHSAKIHHRKLFVFHLVVVSTNGAAPVPDYTQIFVTTSGHPVIVEALADRTSTRIK
jgi:TolB protein